MNSARKIKNVLFSLIAVCLFFGLAEGVLRVAGFSYLPDDSPIVVMQKFGRTNYKELYTFDPGTIWSLKPGALYEQKTKERINRLGFRGPDISVKKTAGAYRVVCLGDSSTFGFGVPYKDTYPQQLQGYLSYRMQDRTVEVINAGVVGYTSTQALEHFKRDALPLDPDAVVLLVGAINESFGMEYTDAQRIARMRSNAAHQAPLRRALMELRLSRLMLKLTHRSRRGKPRPLVPRTPPQQFAKDLEAFAALAREHGFLLVVADPHRKKAIEENTPILLEYSTILKEFADANGFPFVDVRSRFQASEDQNILYRDDYHPRPTGHNLIAQMLTYPIFRHEAARMRQAQ